MSRKDLMEAGDLIARAAELLDRSGLPAELVSECRTLGVKVWKIEQKEFPLFPKKAEA